ncbi:MAG TPA: SCO family protein [Vicinamibacterales bacterium]|nr:SCO family protein [Vicinamibacterales bacterium]
MRQSLFIVKRMAALLVATCAITSLRAQSVDPRDAPPNEERLLNTTVPDIPLTTGTGARATVSQIAHGRPLLLAFVFTRCAGVCSPFLTSWRSADRAIAHGRYLRLVLSFDPRDTATDMSTLARHHALDDNDDWTFAVGDPNDVRRLADATGFWWTWDETRQQFDHPAMLAGIRDGRLVRLLVGGSITSARLDELVREVSGEFVRSYPLPDRVSFRCVRYDPATGRTTLDWGFALLLIPIAATSIGTVVMFAAGARVRGKG